MRRLFWILILVFVVALIVYGVYPPAKALVDATLLDVGGQLGAAILSFWMGVYANPVYQQYHMLFWFVGGCVFMYAAVNLLAKRPTWMWNKQAAAAVTYQNQPIAQAPTVIQPPPQAQAAPVTPVVPPDQEASA